MFLASNEQPSGELVSHELITLIRGQPACSAAARGPGDFEDVIEILCDVTHMADHGDQPAAACLPCERFERIAEAVGVQGAEPLVEEKGLDSTATACGELH